MSTPPRTFRQRSARLLRPVLTALLLGALGALVNSLLLSPVPAPALYLGGLFYLPVLIRFGTGYGLLCATLTQWPLLTTSVYWLPLPELLVLGLLIHRRRLAPMKAALIYWPSMGLVCAAFAASQVQGWNTWTAALATVTPLLSGLVLMALSQHMLGALRRTEVGASTPINQQVGNLLVVFACVPVLVFHVLATPAYVRQQLNKTLQEIEHAQRIAHERYQLLVERNLRGLQTISDMIGTGEAQSFSSYEPFINRVVGNLQEVFTILLIDQDGYARAGAPDTFPDGVRVADAKQFYGDRPYFIEARRDQKPTVSYGIIGRRMNTEPLLSLVAPILKPDHSFAGIVIGNLPVRRLQTVFDGLEHPERVDGLIYDLKQQVLYHTGKINAAPLSALSEQGFFPLLTRPSPPTQLGIASDLRPFLWQGKLLLHSENAFNGGIVLMVDLQPDVATLSVNSVLTLLVLLTVVLAARGLSQRYGKRLLQPLLDLHRHLQQLDPARLHQMPPLLIESTTQEIAELIRSFNGMMVRLAKGRLETDWAIFEKDKLNADLDRRIAERTAELARKAAELEQLSITDSLTGLNNRRYLSQQLQEEWARAQRNNDRFTMLLFDVDHFKRINDNYGHPVGDAVLQRIGQCMLATLRSIDMAARYGGEEFAVLLPGIDASHALVVAERLRLAMAELRIDTDNGPLQFTISIGLCDNKSPDLDSAETLLQRTDQALYRAKQSGRNRCLLWTATA